MTKEPQAGWWNRVPIGTEITLVRPVVPEDVSPMMRSLRQPLPEFGRVYVFSGLYDGKRLFHGAPYIKVCGFPGYSVATMWRPVEYETDEEFLRNSTPENPNIFSKIIGQRLLVTIKDRKIIKVVPAKDER